MQIIGALNSNKKIKRDINHWENGDHSGAKSNKTISNNKPYILSEEIFLNYCYIYSDPKVQSTTSYIPYIKYINEAMGKSRERSEKTLMRVKGGSSTHEGFSDW